MNLNIYILFCILTPIYSIRVFNYTIKNKKIIKYVGKKIIKYSVKFSLLEIYRKNIENKKNSSN